MDRTVKRGGRFWVVQQHDQMTVVEGDAAPDMKVEKGERMKTLHGPYKLREDATRKAQTLTEQTLAYQANR